MKSTNPKKYYNKIKAFFEENYSNTTFDFQIVDNQNFTVESDSEIAIRKIRTLIYGVPNTIWYNFRKLWVNTEREQFKKFIEAQDSDHLT